MAAPAETLNCPMCGAAASTEAARCDHCGARLATVACPSCFGMMFVGAKFCSHCGARAVRTELPSGKIYLCPRCRTAMESVNVGGTPLLECAKCEGLWVDAASLDQIRADREKQSAVLGMPMRLPEPDRGALEVVRYVPCPICGQLMGRVNFARCSGVVVDVCMPHGTWFDPSELRRIVEFIRSGGMEKARAREIEELREERARLAAARTAPPPDPGLRVGQSRYDGFDLALSAVSGALRHFLK